MRDPNKDFSALMDWELGKVDTDDGLDVDKLAWTYSHILGDWHAGAGEGWCTHHELWLTVRPRRKDCAMCMANWVFSWIEYAKQVEDDVQGPGAFRKDDIRYGAWEPKDPT